MAKNITIDLKLYIVKTKMIDPVMPWYDDDSFGIKFIRLFIIVLTIGTNATMCGLGLGPKTFYNSVKTNKRNK